MQYTLEITVRTIRISFAHVGSLSMALEIHSMAVILLENKP